MCDTFLYLLWGKGISRWFNITKVRYFCLERFGDYNLIVPILNYPSPVWPDWAIFERFWLTRIRTIVVQIFCDFWGNFKKHNINVKIGVFLLFVEFLGKIWATFLFQHIVSNPTLACDLTIEQAVGILLTILTVWQENINST